MVLQDPKYSLNPVMPIGAQIVETRHPIPWTVVLAKPLR